MACTVWSTSNSTTDLLTSAIQREKNIKKYPRKWKLNLIESINPEWDDLSSWLLDLPAS